MAAAATSVLRIRRASLGGGGNFAHEISVSGPVDLRRLGEQLEWLRGRLLELAQERNRFLRHMSHELKTPLANIREGTELLMDGAVQQAPQPARQFMAAGARGISWPDCSTGAWPLAMHLLTARGKMYKPPRIVQNADLAP